MKFNILHLLALSASGNAFVPSMPILNHRHVPSVVPLFMSPPTPSTEGNTKTQHGPGHGHGHAAAAEDDNSILSELRTVAMKMHTREQAPREGEAPAPAKPAERYVPTHDDYLRFLVDSHHVYVALEEVVDSNPILKEKFGNSGLERTEALKKDIDYMVEKYEMTVPEPGVVGSRYAEELRNMISEDGEGIPEFICHYYNFYFAHLAGGRMIGKQMSSLLLEGETLEFYKVGQSTIIFV